MIRCRCNRDAAHSTCEREWTRLIPGGTQSPARTRGESRRARSRGARSAVHLRCISDARLARFICGPRRRQLVYRSRYLGVCSRAQAAEQQRTLQAPLSAARAQTRIRRAAGSRATLLAPRACERVAVRWRMRGTRAERGRHMCRTRHMSPTFSSCRACATRARYDTHVCARTAPRHIGLYAHGAPEMGRICGALETARIAARLTRL